MSDNNLFHISQELREIREQLMLGETNDEIETLLAINESNLLNKLVGYNHVVTELDAMVVTASTEIARINDFIKRNINAANKLKYNMLKAVIEFGDETKGIFRLESGTNKFSTRKSTSILINDTNDIPEEYKEYSIKISKLNKEDKDLIISMLSSADISYDVTISIPKAPIKKSINDKIDVPGAVLDTKYSLTVK